VSFTLEHFEGQLVLSIVDGFHGARLAVKHTCSTFRQPYQSV
jgi:hypothetical protein